MKITKYAQSCFLIETETKKILIDPGCYVEKEIIQNFIGIDLILLTHSHSDHCSSDNIRLILENNKAKIYGNKEIVNVLKEFEVTLLEIENSNDFEGIQINSVKAVHGYNPSVEDKPLPISNGYIIDDGKTSIYHCGDTLAFYHEYKADIVLVPACGFGWVMEPEIAVDFCLAMNCKLAIPMHYDSPKQQFLNGKDRFEKYAKEKKLKYKILKNGENVEI